MTTPFDALRELWSLGGGDPSALERVALRGSDPVLPSTFRVGTAAQVTIAAAGLAAAELWRLRSGRAQRVAVDMRAAALEFRSERYLRIAGRNPPPMWDPIAGVYKTGDGRTVRLHTNFPHHRRAIVDAARLRGRARIGRGGARRLEGRGLRDGRERRGRGGRR